MPARKASSKGASKSASKKSGSKKLSSKKSAAKSQSYGTPGFQALYGVVIRDTIARGDTAEMRRLSTAARKHIKDVESALAKLDAKIK